MSDEKPEWEYAGHQSCKAEIDRQRRVINTLVLEKEELRAALAHPLYAWVREAVAERRQLAAAHQKWGMSYLHWYQGPTDGIAQVHWLARQKTD